MKLRDSSQFNTYYCHITCLMSQFTHNAMKHAGPSTESCACKIVRGNKHLAKMTHPILAPVKRGLGTKRAHTKPQSARWKTVLSCFRYGAHDAREGMEVEGSTWQTYPHVASVTELIVGLCRRESNQPRPGVAPGDPQHEAEGWTWCPRGRESADNAATRPSVFVRESEDPAKMPYSRMALVERGHLATAASAESQ